MGGVASIHGRHWTIRGESQILRDLRPCCQLRRTGHRNAAWQALGDHRTHAHHPGRDLLGMGSPRGVCQEAWQADPPFHPAGTRDANVAQPVGSLTQPVAPTQRPPPPRDGSPSCHGPAVVTLHLLPIVPSHLLDTSVYCQPLKPRPLASVQRRWRALGDNALCISAICESELLYGLAWRPSSTLRALYEELLEGRLAVLPVDSAVARCFGQIKAASRGNGLVASDFDFLIAATAKVHCLTLATLNARHFRGIEGLVLEDWSTVPSFDR